MKVASFFTGIGGFDLGLERSGMEIVFQCEKNSFCQKVLYKNWKEAIDQGQIISKGDINEVEIDEIPEADIWCGGFPCQDVSLANQGKRKGLDGERSGLFYKFAELLSQAHSKPQWVILENVPGLLNSNDGEDFRVVLRTLDELGYGISWRILDAKYFGTPQRRRRIYIIGSLGDLRSAAILFELNSIEIADTQGRSKRAASSNRIRESNKETNLYTIQNAGIGRKPSAGPQGKGFRNDGESFTLDSRGSSDAVCKTDVAFGVRRASGVSKRVDGPRYRSLGNAVCVPVIEWIGKRIMGSENINHADE